MKFKKGDKVTPKLTEKTQFRQFSAFDNLNYYIRKNRIVGEIKLIIGNEYVVVDFGKELDNKFESITMRYFEVHQNAVRRVDNNVRRV